MTSDARKWLDKAKDDLETARFLEKNKMFENAAFHYQQSVEKAFKALMVEQDEVVLQTRGCFVLA